ncbi:uncharacterized protein P174DRAFT_6487 [Aspergillus novofumigatus IBT 16806]|uniref:Uncharacterized protein n=1 Tax=Aspergillus novofumigatus (strain IBT 16806) TaxID=1392255 RepID=A0A2I1CKQ3_ASPN1|nr:uncharacterized protein P174DRAFT_6487 [Aspergillus novofumigatus IBT 16806]PKX98193.1 hypothetical protein P174DRAFT_6487 [Aspergillus novofumigatus IBT 16806]
MVQRLNLFVVAPETISILCKRGRESRRKKREKRKIARLLGFCVIFSNGLFLSTSFQTLTVLELSRFPAARISIHQHHVSIFCAGGRTPRHSANRTPSSFRVLQPNVISLISDTEMDTSS